MASTFSPALRIELMATGDQSGTWGDTTNNNFLLFEQAITGVLEISEGDATFTLTTVNGGVDQARNAVLNFTGALTAQRNVVVPSEPKLYLAKNSTTGGFGLNFTTSGGTGVVVLPGTGQWVYCDGTNVLASVLGVAGGGTGIAAGTQYGVPYFSTTTQMASTGAGTTTTVLHGNAAGAPAFGAVVLTTDVSGTLPIANGGTNATTGAVTKIVTQTFTTPGAFTYTPTANMLYAFIQMVGGAGGAGGVDQAGSGVTNGSGSGGGGEYSEMWVTAAQIGASKTGNVGVRGTASSAGNSNGGNGGTSSVSTLVTALGGAGGTGATSNSAGVGGAGGNGGTGSVRPGENGRMGISRSASSIFGNVDAAQGASGPWGSGGQTTGSGASQTGTGYGSSASGCASDNAGGGALAGLAGQPGRVLITEYCAF